MYYGGAPLADALVRLSGQALATTTKTDGSYVFANLAGGAYTLTATSEAWSSEGAVSASVTIASAGVAAPNLVLTPAGALSGTLVQVAPQDLTGAEVTLLPAGTIAFADASGAFDFGRIAAGEYALSAVGNGRVTATNLAVSIVAGQVTSVVLPLVTQEAPPPHVNHSPVVTGITMTLLPAAPSNPSPLIVVPDLPSDDVASGGQAHFICAASDPDGDPLTVAWQVSGGLAAASGDGIDWTAAGESATVGCVVSDGQGGVASASRPVSVFGFNYIGASLFGDTLVVARTNATSGSNDLFVQDTSTQAVLQIASAANESNPQLSATALVYLSDENATAENPIDVYRRRPPFTSEERLSSDNGAEVFSLSGDTVWIGNGATLTELGTGVVLPNGGSTLPSGAIVDKLCAGVHSVMVHATDGVTAAWFGFNVASGEIFSNTFSADSAVAFDGTNFFVADPDAQTLITFADTVPVTAQTTLGALPLLSAAPIASIAAADGNSAASVIDVTGLFGPVLFNGTQTLSPAAPAFVLGVSGQNVLFGSPAGHEVPPTRALYLWAAPP